MAYLQYTHGLIDLLSMVYIYTYMTQYILYINIPIIYIYGGFLKWGYPLSSSIYRWNFRQINHPAIGVLPFMETLI